MSTEQTIGEYRVGVSFNSSNNPDVDELKRLAAEGITAIHAFRQKLNTFYPVLYDNPQEMEIARLIDQAFIATEQMEEKLEAAAMWAVKAVMKRPLE